MKNDPVFYRQSVLAMIGLLGVSALMAGDTGVWSILTTILAVGVAWTAFRQIRRSLPGQPYIMIWWAATITAWAFQQWALHAEHRPAFGVWDIAFPIFALCGTLYLWWKIRTGPPLQKQAVE